MPLTTFEEEIYLRALTGRLVGKAIADLGVNKLAVVAPKNIICSSIAAATEASFLDNTNGVTNHFMVELGTNEDEVVKKVKEFSAQAVLLQFGGEDPIDKVKESFIKLLRAMAREGVPGAIVFHVRIFAAGGVAEAFKDEEIRRYLESKNLYVYTVGFDEGKVYVNRIKVENSEVKLEKLAEYHVTLEHADLLNRSLKNRRVAFQ